MTTKPAEPAGAGPTPPVPTPAAVPAPPVPPPAAAPVPASPSAPTPAPAPAADSSAPGASPDPVPPHRKRAPTLYAIIVIKLLKGALFIGLAVTAYTLSDNDLPAEYRNLLHILRLNPESRIWAHIADQVSRLTETKVLVAAAGLLLYSLFSLIEGVGLCFRISWVGWLTISESAFFIPIEIDHLCRRPSLVVFVVLGINVLVVWYLYQNRRRLFRHRH